MSFPRSWRYAGPRKCHCPKCSRIVSTNALARASHWRACKKKVAVRALERGDPLVTCDRCSRPFVPPAVSTTPDLCPACEREDRRNQ